jgi:hypothetical protein
MRWNLWSRFYAPGLTFLVVQRNTTREKQKAKIVVDAVREHGLVKATGDAELYKMDMLDKYKVLGNPCRDMLCARCALVKEITTWPKFLEDRVLLHSLLHSRKRDE